MNTLNSYGMYDAPRFGTAREPLALTQDDLRRQLEGGAFIMDRDEAIEKGLVNPNDDETDTITILVGEGEKR